MREKKIYALLLLTFVMWGSLYVMSKFALADIPPLTVLFLRHLFSAAALFFLLRRRGFQKIRREHYWCFAVVALLAYYGSIVCQLFCTQRLDSSLAALISALNPVTIPLMAALFLRERLTPRLFAGMAAAVLGVYVILGGGKGTIDPLGVLIGILGVLVWSAASVVIRKLSAVYDPVEITFVGILCAMCLSLPSSLLELRTQPCRFTPAALAASLYMGLVCTALAHTLWNSCLRELPASTCSMFYPVQPLTAALLGIVFLHEKLTARFVVGAVIISVGIVIAVSHSRRQETAPADAAHPPAG